MGVAATTAPRDLGPKPDQKFDPSKGPFGSLVISKLCSHTFWPWTLPPPLNKTPKFVYYASFFNGDNLRMASTSLPKKWIDKLFYWSVINAEVYRKHWKWRPIFNLERVWYATATNQIFSQKYWVMIYWRGVTMEPKIIHCIKYNYLDI